MSLMCLKGFSTAILGAAVCIGSAEAAIRTVATTNVSSDRVWSEVSLPDLTLGIADLRQLRDPQVLSRHTKYRLYTLDRAVIDAILARATKAPPHALLPGSAGVAVTLPLPDGTYQQFNVSETS